MAWGRPTSTCKHITDDVIGYKVIGISAKSAN